jgi:hypothetical protein
MNVLPAFQGELPVGLFPDIYTMILMILTLEF